MKTTKISGWLVMAAALLVMTMGMTGCSSEGDDILGQDSSAQPKETAGVMVTVSAGISDGDGTTRSAVEMDGTKRVLKFTEGDRLYVRKKVSDEVYVAGMLTMVGEPSADGKSATFTGDVAAYNRGKKVSYNLGDDPLAGTTATLVHEGMVERMNYVISTTDGTMNIIQAYAANVEELMTKGLTVKGSYTSGSGYALAASKPIIYCSLSGLEGDKNYKVQLQKPVSGGVSPKGQGVFTTDASGAGTVAIEATGSGVNEWEIAIKQDNTTVGIISLGNRELTAKVYNVTRIWSGLDFVKSELEIPLTFEAKTAGAKVGIVKGSNISLSNPEYTTDGINWNKYTYGTQITLDNVGDKIAFRATNSGYANTSGKMSLADYCYLDCSGDYYVYGNVMSLIDKDKYATKKDLTQDNAFYSLFCDCSTLYNHPTKAISLPATTLASSCYKGMFGRCTSLTTAPKLPAETLANDCYDGMFMGCTSLTTAPELPAETLADNCYYRMFYGCTSLTAAPILPAKTLADYCYYEMFKGCSNLSSVTCLATAINSNNTRYWLQSVAATGTFTRAKNARWVTGTSGIPSDWTVVNAK